jgi:hypothetical protein
MKDLESPEVANPTRFDFHVVDFMNSEDVERMTSDEVGQYILLLCKSWLIGKDTTLPDDPEYLAKQARCKKVSSLVMKKFPLMETAEGPRRRNEILYGEWLLAKDRQTSASERGRKTRSSPIPFHSNSYQSIPDQTKSSIIFTSGSFDSGNWKTIKARWWACFKKQLQNSKQNKEQYSTACSQYGEDEILKYLEVWAEQNSWVSSHPKGGNRLYVFLQAVPEMMEGDQIRDARDLENKKKQEPEIPEEKVTEAIQQNVSERQQEIGRQLEEIKQQKKFEEENRDEI